MPFGLSNAPGTFQRLMNELFREHLWKCALVFLDDVLVSSQSDESHFAHLRATFQLLRAANLKLKPCRLVQREVTYLSLIIGSEGIQVDPKRLQWLFKQNEPDGMSFKMQQQLQEFGFEVVQRAGSKHGNADGLSITLEEGPDWLPGEKEEAFGPCPQAVPLKETMKKDESIVRVFYWAELDGKSGDMPSLGTNLIPKEQAIQYGPEVLAYWSRWNELTIRGGILFKKWFPKDDSRPVLQTVVPIVGRKGILSQLDSSQTSGGDFAVKKTLARIRQ
ncbi:uncharacterized protein LOC134856532 [Symsagittifera roscoffensis]|uniref:uncharacterized protein LOC134856532 n=1 Tax=Symsagittifera roscoffensis TaxID=84072 RepID=UPI00307B4E37